MSSVAQKQLTAEQFWQLPGTEKHWELVRGEVVTNVPPGLNHGAIAANIAAILKQWTKSHGGTVVVEGGYILSRDPDTVRGPDVSYLRAGRVPVGNVPEAFGNLAPDLAIEVLSPADTATGLRDKLGDYLRAGTPMVWFVYPSSREVVAHTADGVARTFTVADTLSFPEPLPGFECRVAELFE